MNKEQNLNNAMLCAVKSRGMYKCAMCGGEGAAIYFDFITEEWGEDTCPDCKGLGKTLTDNKTLETKIITEKVAAN